MASSTADRYLTIALGFVFVLAVLAGSGLVMASGGFGRTPLGGGAQYVQLSRSLAQGRGYLYDNAPHLGRLPLWPLVMAVPARLLPHASDGFLMRITGIVAHALTAVLLALAAYELWRDRLVAATTGIIFAVYPQALALIDDGHCECAFILFAAAGLWLWLRPGRWALAGAFLLGCSVLAYNIVLALPLLMIAIALASRVTINWTHAVAATLLFFLPAIVWMGRNYFVSRDFPLLTAINGETLYGGNNAVVANDLQYWGYWVLPDEIPGEISKHALFERLGEAGTNRYYLQKGFAYMKTHAREYPRLLVGKMVRGFIPVPWVPSMSTLGAGIIRALFYAGVLWALFKRVAVPPIYANFLLAMLLITLGTTLVYYGAFRVTFCLDAFLILPLAAQLVASTAGKRAAV